MRTCFFIVVITTETYTNNAAKHLNELVCFVSCNHAKEYIAVEKETAAAARQQAKVSERNIYIYKRCNANTARRQWLRKIDKSNTNWWDKIFWSNKIHRPKNTQSNRVRWEKKEKWKPKSDSKWNRKWFPKWNLEPSPISFLLPKNILFFSSSFAVIVNCCCNFRNSVHSQYAHLRVLTFSSVKIPWWAHKIQEPIPIMLSTNQ